MLEPEAVARTKEAKVFPRSREDVNPEVKVKERRKERHEGSPLHSSRKKKKKGKKNKKNKKEEKEEKPVSSIGAGNLEFTPPPDFAAQNAFGGGILKFGRSRVIVLVFSRRSIKLSTFQVVSVAPEVASEGAVDPVSTSKT